MMPSCMVMFNHYLLREKGGSDLNAPICPECGSDAVYRYGRIPNGKQRYICILCSRQFIMSTKTSYNNPVCSVCGSKMHCYRKEEKYVRFRCSQYPNCKTYVKIENPFVLNEVKNKSLISEEYNLAYFINSVKTKSRDEVILLAVREATSVERDYIKSKMKDSSALQYANSLKKLTSSLRCNTTLNHFDENIQRVVFQVKNGDS